MIRRSGLSEKESLHFLAALFAQEVELRLGFHTFRCHDEVEAVSHADDGGDDGPIALTRFDLVDELGGAKLVRNI